MTLPKRKIKITSIYANASTRLSGYIDEVLKRGTIDGDFIFLSEEDFVFIRENFSNKGGGSLPSVGAMATSAIQSAIKWVGNGAKSVDDETLKTRIDACRGCEFWNAEGFNGTGRCMKCGCSTWAKLRMATEKCPLGKW